MTAAHPPVAGASPAAPPARGARRRAASATGGPLRTALLQGAVAGIAGGLVFGAAMASLGKLPTIAQIIRVHSAYAGFAVHMTIAALIGAGFGVLTLRLRAQAGELLFWGLAYGAFWWFLGAQTLLPLVLGRPVAWDLAGARALLPSLVGHLFYGGSAAMVLASIRPPAQTPEGLRPWPLRPWTFVRGALAGALTGAVLMVPAGHAAYDPPILLVLVGTLMGAVYPLMFGGRPEGTGPAVIRGTVYGFLWWIVVALTLPPVLRDGVPDWSREAATGASGRLPAYLLLGAGTAAAFTWLGALGRALFVDDVRLRDQEAPGTRGLRALAHGIVAGLAGGLVFTAVMQVVGILPTVARLVGAQTAGAGLAVHLVISQFVGVSYAVLFRRRAFDPVSGLGWGVSYGFVWWVLGWLTLLPVLLGTGPRWNAAAMAAVFPALIGHLGYGAALGVVHQWLEGRANPWWTARSQVEAARITARQRQTLGSAPALWTLTALIALLIPLMVAP